MVLLTGVIVPLLLTVSQLQRLNVASLPTLGGLVGLTGAALMTLVWQQRRAAVEDAARDLVHGV